MAMAIGDFKTQLIAVHNQAIKDQSVTKEQLQDLGASIDTLEASDGQKATMKQDLEGLMVLADKSSNADTKGTGATNSQWQDLMDQAGQIATDIAANKTGDADAPVKSELSKNGDYGLTTNGKTVLFGSDNKPIAVAAMGKNETRKLADGLYANTDANGKVSFAAQAAHTGTAMKGSVPVDSAAYKDKGSMQFDEKNDMFISKQQDGTTKVYDLTGGQIADVPKGQSANIKITNPADPASPYLHIAADGNHTFSATADSAAQYQATLTGKGHDSGAYNAADTSAKAAADASAAVPATALPAPAGSELADALKDPAIAASAKIVPGENIIGVKSGSGYDFYSGANGVKIGTLPATGGNLTIGDLNNARNYVVAADGTATKGPAAPAPAATVITTGTGKGNYSVGTGGTVASQVADAQTKSPGSPLDKAVKGAQPSDVHWNNKEGITSVKNKDGGFDFFGAGDGKLIGSLPKEGGNLTINDVGNPRNYAVDGSGRMVQGDIDSARKTLSTTGTGGGNYKGTATNNNTINLNTLTK